MTRESLLVVFGTIGAIRIETKILVTNNAKSIINKYIYKSQKYRFLLVVYIKPNAYFTPLLVIVDYQVKASKEHFISSGRKHFEAIGADFDVVISASEV